MTPPDPEERNVKETPEGGPEKDSRPARERVQLKHVERSKGSKQAPVELKTVLDSAQERQKVRAPLSNDELTLLSAIGKKRMFLSRIAIIVNQSRAPLGLPLLKEADFVGLLETLEKRGLVVSEHVKTEGRERVVYYLSEEGKDEIV